MNSGAMIAPNIGVARDQKAEDRAGAGGQDQTPEESGEADDLAETAVRDARRSIMANR